MHLNQLSVFFILLTVLSACKVNPVKKAEGQAEIIFIDSVWAGHPVDFDLLTHPPFQFVAYYDKQRILTLAQRRLKDKKWQIHKLDEQTGWDSHNYLSLALDSKGFLHLSGNMHGDSLVYFQASQPYDIFSLQRKKGLIGRDEYRVTYPEFFEAPGDDLIFTYRIGGSGNGNQIYNRYDPETSQWSRLLDQPLIDGEGKMNAYLHGPVLGPDGFFHLVWVWRDTPDAATNHDLSYARSRDLLHWTKSDGTPLSLPIRLAHAEVIDPAKTGRGMINGNTVIGFDSYDKLVVTYHKFDDSGNTQIYQARREAEGWQIYQSTDYDFRWEFGGYGSLNSRIRFKPLIVQDGILKQEVWIDTLGTRTYFLDPGTLKLLNQQTPDPSRFSALDKSSREDFQVNTIKEEAGSIHYYLKWETLPRNRDQPREKPWPPASALKMYTFPDY